MEEEKFIKDIKKVSEPRVHKINNSYGVYDYYKYYRKTKPKSSEYVLTESQYFYIIRRVNNLLIEEFIKGEDIKLPNKMGRLELRKTMPSAKIKDGKLTNSYPIDWDKTLKLWYEDPESYNKRVLVKNTNPEVFRVYYNKGYANYNNKSFYRFTANREFKNLLKHAIKNNSIDAFTF